MIRQEITATQAAIIAIGVPLLVLLAIALDEGWL